MPTASPNLISVCDLAVEASTAWREGKLEEALAHFDRLAKFDEKSSLWPLSVITLRRELNLDISTALESAVERFPKDLRLRLLWAEHRAAAGNKAEALKDAKRLRARGGFGSSDAQRMISLLSTLGEPDYNPPIEVPKIVIKTPPPPGARRPPPPEPEEPQTTAASAAKAAAATATTTTSTAASEPAKSAEAPAAKAAAPASKAGATTTSSGEMFVSKENLTQILNGEQVRKWAAVKIRCEELLKEGMNTQVALCLARTNLYIRKPEETMLLLRKKYPSLLKDNSTKAEALGLLATALEQDKDWEEAASTWEELMKIAPKKQPKPDKHPIDGVPPPGGLSVVDVQGRCAKAFFLAGETQTAGNIAQPLLQRAEMQREACEVGCSLLLDRGDTTLALQIMIQCLVRYKDRPAQESKDLVLAVMKRSSVEELVYLLSNQAGHQVPPESIAELVGYIGLITKESGDVLESCRFYRHSMLQAPWHASLCLNLMHTYSIRRDDLPALAWGLQLYDRWAYKKKLPYAKQFVQAFRGENKDAPAFEFTAQSVGGEMQVEEMMAVGFVFLKLLFLGFPCYSLIEKPRVTEVVEGVKPPWLEAVLALKAKEHDISVKAAPLVQRPWVPNEDTKVAIAETEAHHEVLRQLCDVLEQAKGGRALHLTPVRNEHAYFSCIKGILEANVVPTVPPGVSGPPEPIFMVGDSHVLASAWQIVNVSKDPRTPRPYTIVPAVVTGVKIWHLREASTFYTKVCFWERIAAVPAGAPVIFSMGEIDCREGLSRSVAQGRNKDVETAIRKLADVYVEVLKEVRRRLPRSQVFVHPIPMVLGETRVFTLAFNHVLGTMELREKLKKVGAKYLEFEDTLIGGDPLISNQVIDKDQPLLEHLNLDGTHFSPAYVKSHLEPALIEAWAPSSGSGADD